MTGAQRHNARCGRPWSLDIGHWDFVGHWDLVIGISLVIGILLVIGTWSLVIHSDADVFS
jgi:hypothetical protein